MIRSSHVGERVEWDNRLTARTGIVVELPKHVDYDVEALMDREEGESVATFGRLAAVRCTDQDCQCNRSAWTHSINECQLRPAAATKIEVTLW